MEPLVFAEPIFVCAGEPSADLYAGFFIENLKRKFPKAKIYGVGGDNMRNSGVEVLMDYDCLMTLGFSAGLASVFKNYNVYRKVTQLIYDLEPKTFIAIAYPGLNLLLCRHAKHLGCKVYYLLPPQIWAWGGFRKYFIKKWVDRVISVFPFETEFYRQKGIKTLYLENPLILELKKYRRDDDKKRIGFMPGSRPSPIKRNLPITIALMKKIQSIKTDVEFCLIFHTSLSKKIEDVVRRLTYEIPRLKFITENHYQAMKNCDLLVISSGTASLEAAFMNIPQIFYYRPTFFDYFILKHFLKIKEYNLANIYFKGKIVPSFIAYNKRDLIRNLDKYLYD